MTSFDVGSVRSKDGSTIGYRRVGNGPAVIVVHGGMQAAQNLMGLASALSDEFEVFVPDRRGRGMSEPQEHQIGIARAVEDLQALVEASGATMIFGLSVGALVVLRTAFSTPELTKVALYEPPLSIGGSTPVSWLPRFDREIDDGRIPAALTTALRGMRTDRTLSRIPRFILLPMFTLGSKTQSTAAGDVPIADLVPALHDDITIVNALADTTDDYARVRADVLLLGGTKSPAFLGVALDALHHTLPVNRRTILKGLDHSGPDDNGKPERVADELRGFFRSR